MCRILGVTKESVSSSSRWPCVTKREHVSRNCFASLALETTGYRRRPSFWRRRTVPAGAPFSNSGQRRFSSAATFGHGQRVAGLSFHRWGQLRLMRSRVRARPRQLGLALALEPSLRHRFGPQSLLAVAQGGGAESCRGARGAPRVARCT